MNCVIFINKRDFNVGFLASFNTVLFQIKNKLIDLFSLFEFNDN